jgi:hypothetical protein
MYPREIECDDVGWIHLAERPVTVSCKHGYELSGSI